MATTLEPVVSKQQNNFKRKLSQDNSISPSNQTDQDTDDRQWQPNKNRPFYQNKNNSNNKNYNDNMSQDYEDNYEDNENGNNNYNNNSNQYNNSNYNQNRRGVNNNNSNRRGGFAGNNNTYNNNNKKFNDVSLYKILFSSQKFYIPTQFMKLLFVYFHKLIWNILRKYLFKFLN